MRAISKMPEIWVCINQVECDPLKPRLNPPIQVQHVMPQGPEGCELYRDSKGPNRLHYLNGVEF